MKFFKMFLPHTDSLSYEDICFDMETTGLFPNRHNILVCGIIKKEQNETILLQYCIEKNNEKELIETISTELSNKKNIYTFHGNTFEFPFLNYKQKKLLIPNKMFEDRTHDLSLLISSFRHLLNLTDYKRNTIEKYFKVNRFEEIDVKEWTEKSQTTMDFDWNENNPILCHNRNELLSLLDLKSSFEHWKKTIGFYFPALKCNIYLSNYTFSKKNANIMFLIESMEHTIPLISFYDGFDISVKNEFLILKFDTIDGMTDKNNLITSPVISPSNYFKRNEIINIDNILHVSKQILFHLFCN